MIFKSEKYSCLILKYRWTSNCLGYDLRNMIYDLLKLHIRQGLHSNRQHTWIWAVMSSVQLAQICLVKSLI